MSSTNKKGAGLILSLLTAVAGAVGLAFCIVNAGTDSFRKIGGQYGQGGKDDLHGNEGVVIPGAHADKAGAAGHAVQRVGVGQRVGLPCHGLLDGAHQLGVLTNILGGPVGKLFADSGHRVLTGEGGHRAAVEGILLQQ